MRKIVIIDDSPLILKTTKTALEAAGYQASTFSEPGDFDPTTEVPDLVLVDVNMPQFFGDDVVAYFKGEWPTMEAPIYLFSTVAEDELKERAEACGADGYISKHWGLEGLLSAVEKILK